VSLGSRRGLLGLEPAFGAGLADQAKEHTGIIYDGTSPQGQDVPVRADPHEAVLVRFDLVVVVAGDFLEREGVALVNTGSFKDLAVNAGGGRHELQPSALPVLVGDPHRLRRRQTGPQLRCTAAMGRLRRRASMTTHRILLVTQ
jgi:hypothetical protein